MTFEGEHRQIVMRGIERAMANGVAQDGGMNEVINMIPRNGSFIPYGPTQVEQAYSSYINSSTKMVRVHHTSTGDNTIIVFENYYRIGSNGTVSGKINKKVRNIVFIGNRMDLNTDDGIEHWLWKNGEYSNVDDINIHDGGTGALPSVSFKVSRGIYDGKKVYAGAQFVRLHKHYTDADASRENYEEAEKYVRNAGSMGTDAISLLDSIRHIGGITGYILAAAAWRVKGSSITNPKYIMASPILLLGAPEIYMKDGSFERKDQSVSQYESMPQYATLLDMYDWQEQLERTQQSMPSAQFAKSFQDLVADALWEITDSDDRDVEEMAENEHVNIDMQETTTCVLRKNNTEHYKQVLNSPALWSSKFAIWRGGSDKEHRGIRVTHGSANILYFKLNSELEEKYKDEIDRLCIFVSPVISPYKNIDTSGVRMELRTKIEATTEGLEPYNYDLFVNNSINGNKVGSKPVVCSYFSPEMKSADEIRNEIKNIVGLYKVSEIQLNETNEGADADGWIKVNLSEGRLATDRLVQKSDTMLKLSDLQPVGFTKGSIFGYNERLHVFNFKKNEIYRLPYNPSLYYYGGDGQYKNTLYHEEVEYSLEITDDNNSVTVYRFKDRQIMLNPLVSCPYINAKKIRIAYRWIQDDGLGEPIYNVGELEYKPVEIAGIASGYIDNDLRPSWIHSSHVATEEEWNSAFRDEYIDPDSIAMGRNELRVSNTSTTIFEVDKSYRIGHGEIIGLARLSMGLSQDNYSKFPLVVFCTDGVYTLSVDASGQYAYSSQDPLSRAVCNNANGICEIDGAVLFPTELGLQMVTSNGAKPVTIVANGKKINCPDKHAENGLALYNSAIHHQKVVEIASANSGEDFLAYIQDGNTHISYLHALNSVIVYNGNHPYVYMIELSTWGVTKLELTVFCDDNDYPKQIFNSIGHDVLKPIQFNYDTPNDNTPVLLATRPIALESRQLKTIYRVVLRGAFENIGLLDKHICMLVYGSLDGNHWDYLNGMEKLLTNNRFHDIGVETHHVSYKYMMVVLVGELSKDSHIDGFEVTSIQKYNNKLK